MKFNDPLAIRKILLESKNIAVVGLSSDPMRPSFDVSQYMQKQGYRIIPVTTKDSEILSEKAYSNLADIPDKIDVVNIFRRSDQAGIHVDEAIAAGAKAVWLQEEVIDEAAAQRAVDAGLLVVMDRCLLKEYLRLK